MLVTLVLGCGNFGKRNSASFNPYRGKLSELLTDELSSGLIKFKLVGAVDNKSFARATEAKGFTYMQQAAGIEIKIDGALANYPSAADANAELADIAKTMKGTLSKKGDGQRFTATDNSVAWTNGSLICIEKAGVAKAALNFEEAAPF